MLNNRLLTIANNVPTQARVVDVGCDHAYLAIYLMQHKSVQSVIASDIVDGPVEAARKNIQQAGLTKQIKLVQADGLAGVQPGEVDCVIIAGMGAGTIIDILTTGQQVVDKCQTLILQPMIATDKLRCWLAEHGWVCAHEQLCVDAGRLYEIIVAQPTQKAYTISKLEALVGNLADDELFARHLQNLIDRQTQLLNSLQLAVKTEQISAKIEECRTLLDSLQEVKYENIRNK